MGCGQDDNKCGVDYTSLPVLTGCPGDAETFLVGNAAGGRGAGKYALRLWADIKACVTGSSGGYSTISTTIDADSETYQNDSLKGATEVAFVIVNNQLYTSEKGDFTFNDVTGIITFVSISLYIDDVVIIPYKPN